MPSISELFGNASNRENPFDMDAFLQEIDKEIQQSHSRVYGSATISVPASDESTVETTSSADASTEGTLVTEDAGSGTDGESPSEPSLAQADTTVPSFVEEELARFAEIENRLKEIEVQTPEPEPTVAESPLPDYITEHDRAQVEMFRRLERLESEQSEREQRRMAEAKEKQLFEAATRAVATFRSRYENKLNDIDITNLTKVIGASPIAKVIAKSDPALAEQAYIDLMESTLWKHEEFRKKVLTAESGMPNPAQVEKEASANRKRVLSGLSAAAAPVGDVPTGSLSARPDGRLDEQSRKRLIATVVNQFRAASGGF